MKIQSSVQVPSQSGTLLSDMGTDTATTLVPLKHGETIRVANVRDPHENKYLAVICLVSLLVFLVVLWIAVFDFYTFAMFAGYATVIAISLWVSWKLTFTYVRGHSIEVGPTQYPQIYRIVKQAADILEIPTPMILIMQGHGLFKLLVAKRYTRRGLLIITSNLLDEFAEAPNSRADDVHRKTAWPYKKPVISAYGFSKM